MACTDYQRITNKLLDGEIKAASNSDVFAHLAGCAECRGFFDAIMILAREMDRNELPTEADGEPTRKPQAGRNDRSVRADLHSQRRYRQNRIRTFLVVGALVFLTGMFWTSAISSRPTERMESVQLEMPNH